MSNASERAERRRRERFLRRIPLQAALSIRPTRGAALFWLSVGACLGAFVCDVVRS